MSLAETFSGPVFQMTGLMGTAWLLYIMIKGQKLKFINESIQYQMPLLLVVSIVKYGIVLKNKFHVYHSTFYINLACYIIFCGAIVFIDYRPSK
jgi:Ca2+/Na+ antiporter